MHNLPTRRARKASSLRWLTLLLLWAWSLLVFLVVDLFTSVHAFDAIRPTARWYRIARVTAHELRGEVIADEILSFEGSVLRELRITGTVWPLERQEPLYAKVFVALESDDGDLRPIAWPTWSSGQYTATTVISTYTRGYIAAWAVAPGAHAAPVSRHRVDGLDAGLSVRLDVRLEGSPALRGVVTDQFGRPTTAEVYMCSAGGTVTSPTRADEAGRYEFPIEVQGEVFLRAFLPETGTACAGPVPVDPRAGDVYAETLVLHGDGVITGVARFENGEPAAGVFLDARHVDAVDPDRALGCLPVAVPGSAPGLLRGSGRCDGTGRFSIPGLQPGRYALAYGGRATHIACFADTGHPAELALPGRPLVICVRDATGHPSDGAWVQVSCDRGRRLFFLGRADSSGSVVVATTGRSCLVMAWRSRLCAAEQRFDVAPATFPPERILVLPSDDETGRIRIVGDHPQGEPVQYDARIVRASSDATVLGLAGPLATTPPLSPGSYRLDLTPRPFQVGSGSWYARTVLIADVQPRTVSDVCIPWTVGGRIRVVVHGTSPAIAPHLTVTIARAADDDEAETPEPESLQGGGCDLAPLTLGAPTVSPVALAPGRYDVRLLVRGKETARHEATVRPREFADVHFDL